MAWSNYYTTPIIFIATTRSFKYQNKLKTSQLTIITKTILDTVTEDFTEGISGRGFLNGTESFTKYTVQF